MKIVYLNKILISTLVFFLSSIIYIILQDDIGLFIVFSSASLLGFNFLLMFFRSGNLGLLAASFISITYHFGASITYLFSDYDKILFQTVGRYYNVNIDHIMPAIFYSYFFVLFLGVISLFFKEKMSISLSSFSTIQKSESKIWLIVFSLQFFLISTGQFGYMGYESNTFDNILVLIVDFLSLPLLTITILYYFQTTKLGEKVSIVMLFGLITNLAWNFMYGRRFLIYAVACALLILIPLKLLNKKKLAVVLLLSAVIFVLANIGFVYFRTIVDSDSNTAGVIGSVGASQLLSNSSGVGIEKVFDSIKINLSYRLYIFGYFSEVFHSFEPSIFMQNTLNSLASFLPGLTDAMNATTSEGLVSSVTGWRIYDEAWSILLGSYVDFHILGVILGPIIIITYIGTLLSLSSKINNNFTKLFVICGLMIILIAVETDFTRYVIFLRTCLALFILEKAYHLITSPLNCKNGKYT